MIPAMSMMPAMSIMSQGRGSRCLARFANCGVAVHWRKFALEAARSIMLFEILGVPLFPPKKLAELPEEAFGLIV
jgi:hypothetical protein